MKRPDLSDYVAHFTKGADPVANLVSMLTSKQINASIPPFAKNPCVCLTECPWSSLLDHASRYAPYGIGFHKAHIFACGGGPVYYVRADHWKKQKWHSDVSTFVTPFWPEYRPEKYKTPQFLKGKTIDYSHEREWRVPHDLKFDPTKICFIILDTYEDMAKFPKELKDIIGREKFILMDMYRTIEELWPTHIIHREDETE
jgi:hypothetical protein